MVAEAGYPDGVDITYNVSALFQQLGEAIEGQLAEAGFRATGQVVDTSQSASLWLEGSREFSPGASIARPLPLMKMKTLYQPGGSFNVGKHSTPEFVRLYDIGQRTIDPDKQPFEFRRSRTRSWSSTSSCRCSSPR